MSVSYFGTDNTAKKRALEFKTRNPKHHFYFSLDEVPVEAIQQSRFIILSDLRHCEKDFEALRLFGADPSKIEFYENVEWRFGCSFLGQYLWFGRNYYRSCVYRNGEYLNKNYSGNINDDYQEIIRLWQNTINRWRNNEPTPCDGCFILKKQLWPRNIELKTLSLYGGFKGETCNFSCIYCDATDNLKMAKCKEGITMIDAIEAFVVATNKSNFSVALSAGEITVSPYKKEIFELLQKRNIRTSVFSNGYIFDQDVFHALENNGSINISLDSGTPETFKKIKRVDGYYKVLKNIAQYSKSGGKIELKYIIIEGVNDNVKDINGFVSVCKQYASSVRISCNKFNYKKQLSENTISLIKIIIDCCRNASIPISFSYSQFNQNDCNKLSDLLLN